MTIFQQVKTADQEHVPGRAQSTDNFQTSRLIWLFWACSKPRLPCAYC